MLLLDNVEHHVDSDPWPWGGEPIFRDGKYAGSVTTAAYGFSIDKHVCLGFIHNYEGGDGESRKEAVVTSDWVKAGTYEIEMGGLRFPAVAKLTAPVLPSVHHSRMQDAASRQSDMPTRHVVEGDDFD